MLGRSITVHLPGGRTDDAGEVVIGQPTAHEIVDADVGSLEDEIRANAAEAGSTMTSVEFDFPLRAAPVINVRVDDPAAFARDRADRLGAVSAGLISGTGGKVEGVFIEVDSVGGDVVTVSAYSVRTGEGLGWTRADLETAAAGGGVPESP